MENSKSFPTTKRTRKRLKNHKDYAVGFLYLCFGLLPGVRY